MLYDAILAAGQMIEEYVAVHVPPRADGSPRAVVKRIFVLTDGEDNASKTQPWHVAQYLQRNGLMLDGIPLAGQNLKLQSICTASGGLCFDVHTQEQAMQLFESEATLHLAYRELDAAADRPAVVDEASLRALEKTTAVVTEVRSAVSQTVYAPVMTAAAAQSAAVAAASTATGCRKRVLREFRDIMASPVPGWTVFVSESDFNSWKVILSDVPGSYQGGTWLLTVDFPPGYPFQAPSIRFITPIYHCNISSAGRLCLDVLKDAWNPGLTVAKIFMSISSLMLSPNPDDPLDAFKAQVCRDNPTAYQAAIAEHTARFAGDSFAEVAALYNLA
jgi:ubiquitin-protein ligase